MCSRLSMLKMERMTNSLSDPYTPQESRKTTMVNRNMLEYELKMREAEVQRHLAQSALLKEAMKLKQRSSMRAWRKQRGRAIRKSGWQRSLDYQKWRGRVRARSSEWSGSVVRRRRVDGHSS